MGICCITQGTQIRALWQPGVGGGMEAQEGGEHMYSCGWSMWMYGRKQHSTVIILQLITNKFKNNFLMCISKTAARWPVMVVVSFVDTTESTLCSPWAVLNEAQITLHQSPSEMATEFWSQVIHKRIFWLQACSWLGYKLCRQRTNLCWPLGRDSRPSCAIPCLFEANGPTWLESMLIF